MKISPKAILDCVTLNGGVPAERFAIISDDGKIVVWEPSGEVRTAAYSYGLNLFIIRKEAANV
jgi:hypothetical protein